MPPSCSEELARGIQDSRIVLFEKSGHYPFIEETQSFWAAVHCFLVTAYNPKWSNLTEASRSPR